MIQREQCLKSIRLLVGEEASVGCRRSSFRFSYSGLSLDEGERYNITATPPTSLSLTSMQLVPGHRSGEAEEYKGVFHVRFLPPPVVIIVRDFSTSLSPT